MSEFEPAAPIAPQPQALRQRAIKAGAWTLGGFGTSQLVRLASNLIMTRLLLPEAFGLMAIAMTVHVGLTMLTDIGINASVIRSQNGEDPRFLKTAWTLQILRGLLIWALTGVLALGLYLAVPYFGISSENVYGDPRLPMIIVVTSVAIFIRGFQSLNLALANRDLTISRVVLLEILAQIVAIPIMFAIAFVHPTVWALVAGMLVGALTKTIGSHLFIPGAKMGLGWDRDSVREIIDYGKWLIGASLFGYFANQGDRILFGALLGKEEFGVYVIAMLWISAAMQALQSVIGRLGLPAMSEIIRSGAANIARGYYRFRLVLDGMAAAAFLGLVVVGPLAIKFLYRPEYHPAGLIVQMLSISLLFLPFRALGSVVLAFGDSRRFSLVTLVQAVTMFTLVPLAYSVFGFFGGVVAVAINKIWGLPVLFFAARKRLVLSFRAELLFLVVGLVVYVVVLMFG